MIDQRGSLICERLGCKGVSSLTPIPNQRNKGKYLLVCAPCSQADKLWAELDKKGKSEIRSPQLHYYATLNESRLMEE